MKTQSSTTIRLSRPNPLDPSLVCAVLLGLVAVAAGAGCGKAGDHKTAAVGAAAPGLSGAYALVQVNGKAVPTAVSHDGVNLQVRSGSITFKPDGNCSSKTVFVPPNGTETSREVTANYVCKGSEVTLQWTGMGTTQGRIEGTSFTMNNEGMILLYRK